MKRSDIWFFGVIIIMLLYVILSLVIGFVIPYLIAHFWWLVLFPYVVIKSLFRNSRLFKWLNKKVL